MWFDEEKAVNAFRSGEGVAWGDHDGRLYCGVAAFYRNAYRASLVSEWLPALEGVVAKLTTGARVADIGCGHGHSTLLMTEAFPASAFVGIDSHGESIAAARTHARAAGVEDRVRFVVGDARSHADGGFDLICFFDCLHDMGDPEGALRQAAGALAADGTVMLVEPFAEDSVAGNLNPIGRLYYAASTTLCCAHAIFEGGQQVLGAQAGQARLDAILVKAGLAPSRRALQTPFNLVLETRRAAAG
jgi:SAM-dependent methyltransferase